MNSRLIGFLAGVLAVSGQAGAQAPLFAEDAPLVLVLEIPLRDLNNEARGTEEEGTVVLADGTRLEAKFETRGHARLETCNSVPPLWVNLKKDHVDGTVFAGQNKLKLVTHCRKAERYDDFVRSEYLNYRILSLLTDASYKVRLVQVTYVDHADNETLGPRTGFLIEHKDGLAGRMGLESLEVPGPEGIEPRQLDPSYAVKFEVFAFMIGHHDWSVLRGPPGDECCHNGHLFKPPGWAGEDGQVVGVGYDFDLTGTVSPPYGDPPLNLRNWRQRQYRGWCWGRDLIEAAIDQTVASRAEIETLISSADDIAERRRRDLLNHIENYYEIIENPKRRENQVHKECRVLPD